MKGMTLVLAALMAFFGVAPGLQAQGQSQTKRSVGILVFDITPDGVAPSMITVTEGWYLVRVRNGISLSPLSVRIDHESRGPVMQNLIKAAASAVQELIHLEPGKQTLNVGNQPKWSATIIVTPPAGN